MCTGIAIAVSELPVDLVSDWRVKNRIYQRGQLEEVQFHWWQMPTLIPVQLDGQLQLMPWGNKNKRSPLPFGGWISRDDLELGLLQNIHAEDVLIPANLGQHRGTWFLIIEGIRGILIRDRACGSVVYMLTEPSTNYYRNMTEQEPFMPVLVGQVI
jgi:hypothetical protein